LRASFFLLGFRLSDLSSASVNCGSPFAATQAGGGTSPSAFNEETPRRLNLWQKFRMKRI
jgi:hypothetical protein